MIHDYFEHTGGHFYNESLNRTMYEALAEEKEAHALITSPDRNRIQFDRRVSPQAKIFDRQLTVKEMNVGNLYGIGNLCQQDDGTAFPNRNRVNSIGLGAWQEMESSVYGDGMYWEVDKSPTPSKGDVCMWDYVTNTNNQYLIGSFDYVLDGLPLCKELHAVLLKLKKTHTRIEIRPLLKADRGNLTMVDVFTLWAIQKNYSGNTEQATTERWQEEVKHLECSKRGFINGFHLTAVALYDTRADEYLGVLQYVPHAMTYQAYGPRFHYFSPRVSRDKSEYDNRDKRVYRGDCHISSSNGARLLTSVKKTLKPLTILEKYWVWESRHNLSEQINSALTKLKEDDRNLRFQHQRHMDYESVFLQLIDMFTNDTTLDKNNIDEKSVKAVTGFLEAKEESKANIAMQEGLKPVTIFTLPSDDRVFFTDFTNVTSSSTIVSIGSQWRQPKYAFGFLNSADDLPLCIQQQLAVIHMTMGQHRGDEEYYSWRDIHYVPCVGGYTQTRLQNKDPYCRDENPHFFTSALVVLIPEDEVTKLFENADGELINGRD